MTPLKKKTLFGDGVLTVHNPNFEPSDPGLQPSAGERRAGEQVHAVEALGLEGHELHRDVHAGGQPGGEEALGQPLQDDLESCRLKLGVESWRFFLK